MMYRNTLGVSLLGCVNRSAMLCSSWDTIWSALVLMMGAGVVLGAAVVVVVVTVWLDLDLDFLLRDLLDTRNRLKPGAAVVVVVVVVVAARFFLPKILPEKCKETLFDSINSICKEKKASRTLKKNNWIYVLKTLAMWLLMLAANAFPSKAPKEFPMLMLTFCLRFVLPFLFLMWVLIFTTCGTLLLVWWTTLLFTLTTLEAEAGWELWYMFWEVGMLFCVWIWEFRLTTDGNAGICMSNDWKFMGFWTTGVSYPPTFELMLTTLWVLPGTWDWMLTTLGTFIGWLGTCHCPKLLAILLNMSVIPTAIWLIPWFICWAKLFIECSMFLPICAIWNKESVM